MRHGKTLGLILALALGCAGSAAILFFALPLFQTPQVTAVEPADRARDIVPSSAITITFSAPMNREAVESSIELQPRVSGDFSWLNDETLVFMPRAMLPVSKTLTVRIAQDARSRVGRALSEQVQTRFTTLAYPHVIAAAPALDAQFVYLPNRVTLTFDRALNPARVRENLVITPTLANPTLWIEGEHVILGGFFEPRTRYEIRLARDARDDAYDIPLERDLIWTFTTAAQYPNFSMLNRGRVLDFSASQPIRIPTQFTNVSRLDLALYPIPPSEFDAYTAAPFETWYAFQPGGDPIQKKSVPTNAQLDRYTQQIVGLEPPGQGTYYIKITTPEGPAEAQLVRVTGSQ